jgi:hypothetical protein
MCGYRFSTRIGSKKGIGTSLFKSAYTFLISIITGLAKKEVPDPQCIIAFPIKDQVTVS